MQAYEPRDVTALAREVAGRLPTQRRTGAGPWTAPGARVPLPRSIDPSKGKRDVKLKVLSARRALFGVEEVDLSAVEQIVEEAQVRAIALALAWGRGRHLDGAQTFADALLALQAEIEREGLETVQHHPAGNLTGFRVFELAAFLNRLRSLRVR